MVFQHDDTIKHFFRTLFKLNMSTRIHLTEEEKQMIINLQNSGMRPVEISRRLGIKPQTVYTIVRKFKQRGSIARSPGSGRPPKLRDHQRQARGQGPAAAMRK